MSNSSKRARNKRQETLGYGYPSSKRIEGVIKPDWREEKTKDGKIVIVEAKVSKQNNKLRR